MHPAQVIQASCSQTLGSDLSSRASVKTGCLPSFWVAVKYSIQMELGERALEFEPHYYMDQNGILTFGFCSQGPGDRRPPKLFTIPKIAQNALFYPKYGHFGNCDQFWRSQISGTL